MRYRIGALVAVWLGCLWLWSAVPTIAAPDPSPSPPQLTVPAPTFNSFWEKFDRIREDRVLQELVEDDLEKSIVIRRQIQAEVDRAFNHTTTLINVLLGILTFLPILAAVSVWFIRRSVINQIMGQTQQQMREEVAKQLDQEIAAELKVQTDAFKQELEKLRAEFADQLTQLKSLISDTQTEKDRIITELSQITPLLLQDSASPETQQKIQSLTQQLERLRSRNAQLAFSANDYFEQGKALYFEGCYTDAIVSHEKAIQCEPDNPKPWLGKAASLVKLQRLEEAIAAYDRALEIKSDFVEAWFGKGTALAKMQKLEAAIAAYTQATQLKPDFFAAWFSLARSEISLNRVDGAIAALETAWSLNPDKCRELLKTDAVFEAVRSQPAIQAMVDSES